jgi:hypothetical protein
VVADEQQPFADVREEAGGFSIPRLKWRELLFIGALRKAADGHGYERDHSRPMPPFRAGDLFPRDARFLADPRRDGRVLVRRI